MSMLPLLHLLPPTLILFSVGISSNVSLTKKIAALIKAYMLVRSNTEAQTLTLAQVDDDSYYLSAC